MINYTLISGASSGIGEALSKVFAKNSHNLVLVARRKKRLTALQKELEVNYKIDVKVVQCDLTDDDNINNLYAFIKKENINVSTLINNAGLGDFTLFENSNALKNKQLINLNIHALVKLTHLFLPDMVKNKNGNILNIASMAAYMPGPYIAVYAASKAFVLNFTHAIASENKQHGINISVLSPGDISTEFQNNAGLDGFEAKSNITVDELAEYTYKKFIIEKEREIIPPETAKMIEMMNRSGKTTTISDNMYNLRKQLARKLGKI